MMPISSRMIKKLGLALLAKKGRLLVGAEVDLPAPVHRCSFYALADRAATATLPPFPGGS
jgi:hypothetical protein